MLRKVGYASWKRWMAAGSVGAMFGSSFTFVTCFRASATSVIVLFSKAVTALAAVQIGVLLGANVTAVASSDEKLAAVWTYETSPLYSEKERAALGFAPMALSTSAGSEVQQPLATAVIGGMIQDTFSETFFKIPFLGDIPGIGNLFKSRGRQREKTNLMVFIRPRVLRNAEQAAIETNSKYNYMRNRQIERVLGEAGWPVKKLACTAVGPIRLSQV